MAKFADVPTAQTAVDGLLVDFAIVGPDKTILTRARTLPMTDFEDCVVAASAGATGCDHIVTRNGADFAGSPVSALTPTDFLALLPASTSENEAE